LTQFDSIPANAESSINRTCRGISIDLSDEYENANDSIRFNRKFDSNAIGEIDSQDEKLDDPRILTFRGMSIDSRDE
jgi:hypothetical protein